MTAPEFWNAITWFWTTRHRWPRISRTYSRAIDIFREIGFPWSLVSKLLWSKSHPRKKGRSILSDHVHFSYLCHFLLHSIFGTGHQGKPISRKISIAREWDRDIRGQRCLFVQNHVTAFQNSCPVTSEFTSFPEVLVAWQRDRDILVQRLDIVYSHVTKVR